MSKTVIGIDLGTTNSCVSVIEGGQAVVIANSEGKRTTPSIVGFLQDGERKVGDPAKRQMITNTDTIYSIKRLMGKKYSDVKHMKFPFDVIEGNNGMAVVKIGDRTYTPQEISAIILQKMKKTAEEYLGKEIKEAVITVPAYFNDQERTATKEAGIIAGLDVKRIINEPTAAALAYGIDKIKEDKKIVVYDIGGGTSDISILEFGDGVFEVKSTKGDSILGGDNFDDVIVEYIVEEFKKEHKLDLRDDKIAFQRIREAAERAKIELSTSAQTEINLPYIMPVNGIPKHLVLTLTRSKFEQLSTNLIDKLKKLCVEALNDSNFNINEIDEVILVGGSTRIPMVQDVVKQVFKKEPSKNVNPDEAIAIGAAIQGGVLTGSVNDILLLDVIPISLGIETMGGVMTKLIDANTTIPTTKTQVFSTASDNQNSVEIHVLQGERPMANNNKTLGRFHLDNIPPAKRGIPQIEVSFSIDANGILDVTALDKGTGKKHTIKIEGSSNMDTAEIERLKKEASENAEFDKKKKDEIDTINSADSMIFTTEKQIEDLNDKLTTEDKDELSKLVENLKSSKNESNYDKIKTDIEELNKKWNLITIKMYQQNQTTDTNNVQDAEYQSV